MGVMAPDHLNPEHIEVHGAAVDHPAWAVGRSDGTDDFDGAALEQAMLAARQSAYSELADIDAA